MDAALTQLDVRRRSGKLWRPKLPLALYSVCVNLCVATHPLMRCTSAEAKQRSFVWLFEYSTAAGRGRVGGLHSPRWQFAAGGISETALQEFMR